MPILVANAFTDLMARGEPITLFGAGDTRRDYTYVDDIIDGVVRCGRSRNTPPAETLAELVA